MIVPMKKLSVVLFHRQKDEFLNSLRELGVVHIVEKVDESDENLQALSDTVRSAERVAKTLQNRLASKSLSKPGTPPMSGKDVLESFERLESERDTLTQQIASLRKDIAALSPWGDFDPRSVERLGGEGIRLRFYEAAQKKFEALGPEAQILETVGSEGGRVRFIALDSGTQALAGAEEIVLPKISLSDAKANLEATERKLDGNETAFDGLAVNIDAVRSLVAHLKSSHAFESARRSMQEAAEGHVVAFTGWLPAEKEKMTAAFCDGYTAWYALEKPLPGDDVPVLLKNNPFARLIEPITKIFSLPAYIELDPTPMFAPFFVLFVGLCLGDIAYGLIVAAIGAAALMKGPEKIRPLASLITIIGLSVTGCGVLLNSCFGRAFFGGTGVPAGSSFLGSGAAVFAPLGSIETSGGTLYPAMTFALVLGFVQVSFAIALKGINRFRQFGFVFSLQPLASLCMIYGGIIWAAHANTFNLGIGNLVIGPLQIGRALCGIPLIIAQLLLYGGLALLFLFNNPDKKIGVRIPLGLWELYGFISGTIGDMLSYLRLFALGLSGGLLGNAFNYIAMMFIMVDGRPQWKSPMVVFTVLVLVVGHSLNLALSSIGSFVHPLRLTFVEFYKNLDFKGGGKPYRPLSKAEGNG